MLRKATWQLGLRVQRRLPQGIPRCPCTSPCQWRIRCYETASVSVRRVSDISNAQHLPTESYNHDSATQLSPPNRAGRPEQTAVRGEKFPGAYAPPRITSHSGRPVWQHARKQRRRKNRLLEGVLDRTNSLEWKRKVAALRGRQLHIVLLQILIRKEALAREDRGDLLKLLPDEDVWTARLQKTANRSECTVEDLCNWADILEPKSDDARCKRFMQQKRAVPLFILVHLLRHSSKFQDVASLGHFIDLFHTSFGEAKEATTTDEAYESGPNLTAQRIQPNEYSLFISLLAYHCIRLEPRLLVNLANAVAFYIETYPNQNMDPASFQEKCKLLNDSLVSFRPQSRLHVEQTVLPNAYFWEAQRILLSMSDRLERPLLIDGRGFRAIRDVLAGMPKSGAEVHNSLRHAPTWPPYLRPGDGIDETTDPEDNWGRTVGAGMLMQEAGFDKNDRDEALDILQGMASDGTPTIQQRILSGDWRRTGTWEASIRATRNAQEAWGRFLAPPTPGAAPGIEEYAAMFEKLVLREAKPESGVLPGDKAANFPVHRQANLADIEWARQHPPSVSQLYDQMRLHGLHPTGHCLHILVANAGSVDLANRYLTDAAVTNGAYRCLISDPDSPALKEIHMGLVSAYVNLLLRADGKRAWKHFRRALRVAATRLEGQHSRWVPTIWGPILKNLSQHHHGLRMSLAEQVTLIMQIAERIEAGYGLTLATFNQLNKCTTKIISRELHPTLEELESKEIGTESLLNLYKQTTTAKSSHSGAASRRGQAATPQAFLFKEMAKELKNSFRKLQQRELALTQHIESNDIAPLDYMTSRRDPVKSEHALEYMTALAFTGEYKEMQTLLQWLIGEWGKPDIIEAIETLNEPPSYAEFSEVLCMFRLFAEPMLDAEEVAALRGSIGAKGLTWAWPDNEAVEAYFRAQSSESLARLRGVVQWMQSQ